MIAAGVAGDGLRGAVSPIPGRRPSALARAVEAGSSTPFRAGEFVYPLCG